MLALGCDQAGYGLMQEVKKHLEERGLEYTCLLYTSYHVAMKYVAPIRKELGIRTVFNILGPLSNPAGANMELMLSLIHICWIFIWIMHFWKFLSIMESTLLQEDMNIIKLTIK